jgi:hypothetical protein
MDACRSNTHEHLIVTYVRLPDFYEIQDIS